MVDCVDMMISRTISISMTLGMDEQRLPMLINQCTLNDQK